MSGCIVGHTKAHATTRRCLKGASRWGSYRLNTIIVVHVLHVPEKWPLHLLGVGGRKPERNVVVDPSVFPPPSTLSFLLSVVAF